MNNQEALKAHMRSADRTAWIFLAVAIALLGLYVWYGSTP
jgi:hypothetical protein